ncbi:alpha/beta hydrolase [Streptomyces sp. WZ.A104]|uniref:alpha/beta fold hydrolase n=1 Tax=Streptomyces sp. WZ.A104 TaxID=2023771 RepID=UPI000BBBF6E8|nr:alpha/beta hydrolase [Streptomyces sp. WZ.A104]PCG86727.1 alpha/beta hydrolase [Streptomyces sp. WZ.A104]
MARTEALASTALNIASRVSGRLAGAGAYALFHMPLARSRMRTSERELFGTAETTRLKVSGKSAVVYRWGDGERPVLLVHGWQSRGSRFADFIPGLLERGYSVITFDAPGHGDASGRSTTILEYRHILTELHKQYGEFEAVVAHSLGALGSIFSLAHGVKAKRIATISGVCDFEYLIEEFCAAVPLRPQLKALLRERVGENLFSVLPVEERPFSAVNAVTALDMPLLVVHDEDDPRILVEQGHRLAGAFGDQARLVVTSTLGHRRILGDPDVVRTVLDFVAQGPDRAAEAGTEAAATS